MARIDELRARAKRLLKESQDIRDKYKADETMTQEDANRWDALLDEHDEVKAELAREERAARLEVIKETPVAELPQPEREALGGSEAVNKAAEAAALKAYSRYLTYGAQRLRESDLEALKAYQADNDQEGGFLVAPLAMVSGLLKALDDEVFMRGLARKFTVAKAESLGVMTLESDVDDPVWTSELETGDEEDGLRLGQRQLFPHPLAKRVKVSRTLLRRAQMDPANLLIERITRKFGVVEENNFLTGDGDKKPMGVFTAASAGHGITTARDVTTGSTTNFTADKIIHAVYTLKAPYRRRARWVLHRDCLREIRKLKYGDGTYIWASGITTQAEPTIMGIPYIESEYAPNTMTNGNYAAILGDFSFYWIADALDITFQVLNELYAVTNQIGYIGRKETDGMPVLDEAFVRLKFGA